MVTLIISDVPGDDPSVIASGPTVADPTTLGRGAGDPARATASTRRRRVRAQLDDPAAETPKPGDPAFARVANAC